jgi:hypothetical protein
MARRLGTQKRRFPTSRTDEGAAICFNLIATTSSMRS